LLTVGAPADADLFEAHAARLTHDRGGNATALRPWQPLADLLS